MVCGRKLISGVLKNNLSCKPVRSNMDGVRESLRHWSTLQGPQETTGWKISFRTVSLVVSQVTVPYRAIHQFLMSCLQVRIIFFSSLFPLAGLVTVSFHVTFGNSLLFFSLMQFSVEFVFILWNFNAIYFITWCLFT